MLRRGVAARLAPAMPPRAALMLLGYGVMLAVFARGDTFYWALIAAPLALLGLVFVPDGIAALIAAALDRRAVTVTKVVR